MKRRLDAVASARGSGWLHDHTLHAAWFHCSGLGPVVVVRSVGHLTSVANPIHSNVRQGFLLLLLLLVLQILKHLAQCLLNVHRERAVFGASSRFS